MSAKHEDLVKEIRLYISEIGGLSIKTETPGQLFDRNGRPVRIGRKGVLDIHACVKGRFVAIDAKTGRDRLKREQLAYAEAVKAKGGLAFAAYSVADVAQAFKAEGLIDG